ncbi:PI-PLC X domain-containing protein 1 [Merluccius polli]|uniref:PI-PLC X domain-containing protein 1 n=1 Tax=Merluccius polli TaxID=89951 RepID=A0AA47NWS6_MERPO|nr:PI-PLC X domain-containing protein 1 [Merluccius polli]
MAESGPVVSSETLSGTTDHSDWMSKIPEKLQHFSLWKLAIPGSHDSMGYDLDMDSSIVEPDSLVHLGNLCCVRSIIRDWATTQEMNIIQQLDAGVRYFDLRVARKLNDTNPTRLYFYHGLYTHSDVETVLGMFNDWAERHPKEILVVALSHFKGMEEPIHIHLLNFITTLFGAKLIHKTDHPTLQFCWESGRHVLISYDFPANQYPGMWRKIPYFYGNTIEPSEVITVLDEMLQTRRPPNCTYCSERKLPDYCCCYFYVCGLNLTLPEGVTAVTYMFKTLKSATVQDLPTMLDWVKKQDPGAPNARVNIIATDFVNRLDFVPTVVKLNDKLSWSNR